MECISQCGVILRYMKKHGSITTAEAFGLGITRLSSRINDLKHKGVVITDKWEYGISRYGKHVRYKRFYIKEEEDNSTE